MMGPAGFLGAQREGPVGIDAALAAKNIAADATSMTPTPVLWRWG